MEKQRVGFAGSLSSEPVGGQLTDAQVEELRIAFDMIDIDKSGALEAGELKRMLQSLESGEVADEDA